jgi:hypothetical protein
MISRRGLKMGSFPPRALTHNCWRLCCTQAWNDNSNEGRLPESYDDRDAPTIRNE